VIIHGDNLVVMERLEREGVVVDLAYLDPPFLTGDRFEMPDGRHAFDDRWPDRATYLAELAKRLLVIHRLLAPHGSLVVHTDPKTSHYIKVWADAAFGAESFASEVIWRYRRWPAKTQNFQAMHDVLLRYRKDPTVKPRWNQLYEPLAESTKKTWGTRKQKAVFVNGHRSKSSKTEEETQGAPMSDVWDVGVIAPMSKERTGYPTQKPEALLERVIGALSNPGDLVLDPYMGSGTTLAVAHRMGRRAIGIDASPVAIEVATERLSGRAA
jgi:DNA modification methylase